MIDFPLSLAPSSIVKYSDLTKLRRTLASESDHENVPLVDPLSHNDIELYRAYRDYLEPIGRGCGRENLWRADLVHYSGSSLPGKEVCRSIGHWNPPNQLEIFEVLLGTVYMLIQSPSGPLEAINCIPGETWAIPKGSFHITYAVQESIVINIYNSHNLANDPNKYQHKDIPSVFVSEEGGAVLVVSFGADGSTRRRFSDIPTVSCKNISLGVARLHKADDDEFSLCLGDILDEC